MHAAPFSLGGATLARVFELALRSATPAGVFPDLGPGALDGAEAWLPPGCMDAARQRLYFDVNAWLVRTQGLTVLIDPGAGNAKDRPHAPGFHRLNAPFLDNLARLGVTPEMVDYVLLTHLHVDHAGGCTRLDADSWVPAFPNARYVFSRREYEYFTGPANYNERNRTSFQVIGDSVQPVIDSGQALMLDEAGGEVPGGFTFVPAPGHTAGQAVIVLDAGGSKAVFAGDVLHHPIQMRFPELNSVFDAFAGAARQTRRNVLDYAAGQDALLVCAHFPPGCAGYVTRQDESFVFARTITS